MGAICDDINNHKKMTIIENSNQALMLNIRDEEIAWQ